MASYRPLESKLAIVTGSSRGIGAAIAENLASKGAHLVLNYTSDKSGPPTEELAKNLESAHGIKTLVVQADLGNTKGPSHLISTVKNHFSHPKTGKFQIDILINNAGVSINRPLRECDAEDFNFQYSVNVLGPLLLVQAAIPYLPNDRSGRIVNVSSVSAMAGFANQTVYGGTKAALEAMTRTWSVELAERATVNAVNPGPVKTDMWSGTTDEFRAGLKPWMQIAPLQRIRPEIDDEDLVKDAPNAGGRPAYPSEIAGIVGMLCTPDSAWCTGQAVCANGGLRFAA